MTSHQLRQQKEVEKQAAAEESKKRELAAKREVTALKHPFMSPMFLYLCNLWHSVWMHVLHITASNGLMHSA